MICANVNCVFCSPINNCTVCVTNYGVNYDIVGGLLIRNYKWCKLYIPYCLECSFENSTTFCSVCSLGYMSSDDNLTCEKCANPNCED